jgi:hypothetical protein
MRPMGPDRSTLPLVISDPPLDPGPNTPRGCAQWAQTDHHTPCHLRPPSGPRSNPPKNTPLPTNTRSPLTQIRTSIIKELPPLSMELA